MRLEREAGQKHMPGPWQTQEPEQTHESEHLHVPEQVHPFALTLEVVANSNSSISSVALSELICAPSVW